MSNRTPEKGDITVTALYTSWVWRWGRLPGAELLATHAAWSVFFWVNLALRVARLFISGLGSLRHALLHRHTLVDHLLRTSGTKQVLELAAGLSRRGLSFSGDPGFRYVEVDLPKMVSLKQKLLGRSPEGRAVLARTNLTLVAGDATTLDLATLRDPGATLFVIAEGLCMYLEAEAQRALFQRVAGLLRDGRGGTFVFDLVPAVEQPKPGAFGRALGAMMRLFTRGQTFVRDTRTRDDISRELIEAGFDAVERYEPANVAGDFGLPFPDVPTQQLVFVARVGAA